MMKKFMAAFSTKEKVFAVALTIATALSSTNTDTEDYTVFVRRALIDFANKNDITRIIYDAFGGLEAGYIIAHTKIYNCILFSLYFTEGRAYQVGKVTSTSLGIGKNFIFLEEPYFICEGLIGQYCKNTAVEKEVNEHLPKRW